jgi:hypothetical protein
MVGGGQTAAKGIEFIACHALQLRQLNGQRHLMRALFGF